MPSTPFGVMNGNRSGRSAAAVAGSSEVYHLPGDVARNGILTKIPSVDEAVYGGCTNIGRCSYTKTYREDGVVPFFFNTSVQISSQGIGLTGK